MVIILLGPLHKVQLLNFGSCDKDEEIHLLVLRLIYVSKPASGSRMVAHSFEWMELLTQRIPPQSLWIPHCAAHRAWTVVSLLIGPLECTLYIRTHQPTRTMRDTARATPGCHTGNRLFSGDFLAFRISFERCGKSTTERFFTNRVSVCSRPVSCFTAVFILLSMGKMPFGPNVVLGCST